jgi:hypothetical protein
VYIHVSKCKNDKKIFFKVTTSINMKKFFLKKHQIHSEAEWWTSVIPSTGEVESWKKLARPHLNKQAGMHLQPQLHRGIGSNLDHSQAKSIRPYLKNK